MWFYTLYDNNVYKNGHENITVIKTVVMAILKSVSDSCRRRGLMFEGTYCTLEVI